MTMPSTLDRPDVDRQTGSGEGHASHIVPPTEDMTAAEVVMQARINGTPITALCGYTWVPSRDPRSYPICSRCKDIREMSRPDEGEVRGGDGGIPYS